MEDKVKQLVKVLTARITHMKRLRLTIIGLVLLLPMTVCATVDFLSVNKITKEYYWGDEDNYTGWIGWTCVPEGQLDTAEGDLKKLGYTETNYPYKIESCITLLVVFTLELYIIRKKVKKLRSFRVKTI